MFFLHQLCSGPHHDGAKPGGVGAHGIAQDGLHTAHRRQRGMDGGRHNRRRGGAAHIGLATHRYEEEGGVNYFCNYKENNYVDNDPHKANEEKAGVFKDGQNIHLHADGSNQNVQKKAANFGGSGSFKLAGAGKREGQPARSSYKNNPEERKIMAKPAKLGSVLANPGSNGVGTKVPNGRYRKSDGHNAGYVGQRRNFSNA